MKLRENETLRLKLPMLCSLTGITKLKRQVPVRVSGANVAVSTVFRYKGTKL